MAAPFRLALLGSSAILGGALLVAKGLALALWGVDPDVTAFAQLLFAIGLAGLVDALPRPPPRIAWVGGALVGLAVLASAFAAAWFLAFAPFPPGDEPLPFRAGLGIATFGTLFGLLVLGVAVLRFYAMEGGWRRVPLFVGVVWFPLLAAGFGLPDEGLVLPGILWALVGFAIVREAGVRAQV